MSLHQINHNEIVTQQPVKSPAVSGLLNRFRRKGLEQFLKFGLVGTLGAVIDFSVLNYLIFVAGWNGDTGRIYANLISTGAAILSNFIWNRLWTFPGARQASKSKQLLKFVTVSISGLAFNSLIFFVSFQFVYAAIFPLAGAVQLAKATASGLVLFWNFNLNRNRTFRRANTSYRSGQ